MLELFTSHLQNALSLNKQQVADRKAMEIDVGEEDHSVMDNVETVEVVASGDDMPVTVTSAGTVVGGLMDQHMIIANPEGILVPTSEVNFLGC